MSILSQNALLLYALCQISSLKVQSCKGEISSVGSHTDETITWRFCIVKPYSSLVIIAIHKRFVYKQKPKFLRVTTKLLIAGMQNF